jgi:hypothetical protein
MKISYGFVKVKQGIFAVFKENVEAEISKFQDISRLVESIREMFLP